MVIFVLKYVVPSHGIVEPDIEDLVALDQLVRHVMISLWQQISY